jgi:hypothetical protein
MKPPGITMAMGPKSVGPLFDEIGKAARSGLTPAASTSGGNIGVDNLARAAPRKGRSRRSVRSICDFRRRPIPSPLAKSYASDAETRGSTAALAPVVNARSE